MSASTPATLETAIRSALAPSLREHGFTGSGRTFRLVSDGWVQVVNVQGSRWGGEFAINLGIHPLAIPDVLGNPVNPKKVTESLCEFRRRLSPSGEDHWWKHDSTSESMLTAVSQATDVFLRFGLQLFERVSGNHGLINTVLPEAFAMGQFDFAGFGSTEARLSLVLARLRRSQGRTVEASMFARHGLEVLGGASAIRQELEEMATQQ